MVLLYVLGQIAFREKSWIVLEYIQYIQQFAKETAN